MKRQIVIPYGNRTELIDWDGMAQTIVARPPSQRQPISESSLVRSIEDPSAGPPFTEFLKGARRLLILVNDGTRRTATSRVLAVIRRHLERVDYRILIASGAHRKPSEDDLRRILGESRRECEERVLYHDSREKSQMVYLGRSKRGTDLMMNSLATQSDRTVVVTSVEPHYFAGFMGGRKSFLPGIASYETIVQNHRLALHPMARTFSLERNPVHNDMMAVLDYLDTRRIFSIQLLQNLSGEIVGSLCGDIRTVFFTQARSARELYGARIGGKVDILMTVVPDPELSLYRCRKAICYGMLGLKRGGILIVVSPCNKGLGNPDFFDPIIGSHSPQELSHRITADFQLGCQRLAKWIEAPLWGEVWLVSSIPDRTVAETFLKPYGSVKDAYRDAVRKKGRSAKVAVLLDGIHAIPILR